MDMHFPSRLSSLAKPGFAAMSLTVCHAKVVPGQAAEPDTRQYHEARSREVAAAKAGAAAGKGPSPYPHKFSTTIGLRDYVQRHRDLPGGLQLRDSGAAVAGRVILKRAASSKLVFYTVQGEGVQLQLMADLTNSGMDAAAFVEAHAAFKRGDIVGARGYVGTSMKGELSLWVQQMVLLAPCLHMLPKPAQNGTVAMTQEVRYRQRYLDGIVNPANVRRIFTTRARVVQFVRRYLDDRGYLEVETPVLQRLPGGASARPFVTHHNDLQQQLYLRIATELPLKQLVVGGLDRVYEIGRLFRNEGIDLTHNPEFTSCEGYQAHADYTDMMALMEGMISQMVLEITGSYRLQYHAHGPSKPATEINFEPPWRRIDMISGLEEALGVSFPTDLASAETQRLLDSLCAQHQVDCGAPRSAARLLDKLAAAFLEVQLVDPGFICHQPLLMSPLAKEHPSKPGLAERFELFVNQRELVNAFSELNDPDVQRERFLEQARAKAAGDAEAMQLDEDFCASLEYGLPPTGGFGLGIDRLTMLLTDCTNIKEVLLFPAMRPVMQSAGVTASGSA